MRQDAESPLLERFRASITARIGLEFDDDRASSLAAVLNERASALRLTPDRYVEQLASAASFRTELHELARSLTVPETYFFRNQAQLDACMEGAVPACLAQQRQPGLRILSAACASGEEPYTLAILLRERWPAAAATAKIIGADINHAMLQRARRARYTAWSLRETPQAWKDRYFVKHGADFELDPSIRAAVSFESLNLVDPELSQLTEATYDIVFCRNALMYFTPEQFARAVGRLARSLIPGGFFFLGHAETLRGVSQDFHLCHVGDAFYYQRKEGRLQSWHPASANAAVPAAVSETPLPELALDPRWYDLITQSSDRVNVLHGNASPREAASSADATTEVAQSQLLPLLENEQFAAALDLLQAAAPSDDADHMLLQALVAAQAGRFDTARELCQAILQTDELNAGAQYVLALCHEHAGEVERAIYHDQLAAYLDPGFAIPRLHLGLLHKRRGDPAAADRELREARKLIEREDASRLLLFGGGFGRGALLALCDAELATTSRQVR